MTRSSKRALAAALVAIVVTPASAIAETYKIPTNPPCLHAGFCVTTTTSPPGWKCHWSMDLKGKEIKSLLVTGGPYDATVCDLKACTDTCAKTPGCVAVDLMKPGKIDGLWNDKCVCTLFSSVTSAAQFEEIRKPADKTLSGLSCLRLPKAPPPPIRENPNFDGADRRTIEQDRMRPVTPDARGR